MIFLTKDAINKLKEIAAEEGIEKLIVRVGVLGGSCAGYSYNIKFDDVIKDIDEQFDFDDLKIIIDPLSYQYLNGTEIGYSSKIMQSGFTFSNPNATGSCGCGKSFSV